MRTQKSQMCLSDEFTKIITFKISQLSFLLAHFQSHYECIYKGKIKIYHVRKCNLTSHILLFCDMKNESFASLTKIRSPYLQLTDLGG